MLVILSPAKDMKVVPGFKSEALTFSTPQFLDKASELVSIFKKMDFYELSELLNTNEKLSNLNYARVENWKKNHDSTNSSASVLSYKGEVYRGLNSADFSMAELEYSQDVLRILSALYGILRPLDLIQAHRLELETKFKIGSYKNLYKFWGDAITCSLNEAIANSPGEKVLINLASHEYSSVVNFGKLEIPVITPVFKAEKSGKLKMITVYAKRARGLMARFIIKNRLENSEDLKAFTDEGYYFENQLSNENSWLFVR
jgi:uncharacterized protein